MVEDVTGIGKMQLEYLFNKRLSLFEQNANIVIQKFNLTLQQNIIGMQASGMNDDDIFKRVNDDLYQTDEKGNMGGNITRSLYVQMFGQLESEMKNLEQEMADHWLTRKYIDIDKETGEVNEVVNNNMMMWVAALMNTCADCGMNHGETDSYDNWVSRGRPPLHPRCACILIDDDKAPSYKEIEEPIKLASRAARIKIAEYNEIKSKGGPTNFEERSIFRLFGNANSPAERNRRVASFRAGNMGT